MAAAAQTEPWAELLATGREDGRLVREAYEGAREPTLVPVPGELHPALRDALATAGVERLYAHQAEALHSAWEGPTFVTSGTASGKSLWLNVPTLVVLCRDA
jgi:DEAD/DEAH box helicase domain-containing protein